MTKAELVECIIAVARSPSEDDQTTKMVNNLIGQYLEDNPPVATYIPRRPRTKAFLPGEARKAILGVLLKANGPMSVSSVALNIYRADDHEARDSARATLNKLHNIGLVLREDQLYTITRSGIAKHAELVSGIKSSEPEAEEPETETP